MRLFAASIAFALLCAAAAAAQSGRRVRPAEPAASPTPDERQSAPRDPAKDAEARPAADDDDATAPTRDEEGNRVYAGRQVDLKARLLSKPEPGYPRRARRSNVQGRVVLRLVLAASGKVEQITVVKGLPEGVTEEAIKAARQIKFLPAEREGRKVSQWVTVVYNFNLY